MMYKHSIRFQIIMRDALRACSLDPITFSNGKTVRYSDQAFLEAVAEWRPLKPEERKGRSTLANFRNARFPRFEEPIDEEKRYINDFADTLKDQRLAEAVWDYLTLRGYIAKVIPAGAKERLNKKLLVSQWEAASTMGAFFDTHEMQIKRFSDNGLTNQVHHDHPTKTWFCLKNSWHEKDAYVKSEFQITNVSNEYFSIVDSQRISGRFTKLNLEIKEISTGFGISKSDKLWCFLREGDRDQPRVGCFFRPIKARGSSSFVQDDKLQILYGHIMEAERLTYAEFYSTFAVLMSVDFDRNEWEKKFDGEYNYDDQIDVFPYKVEHDKHPTKRYTTPDYIIHYLKTGRQTL